ncbi:sensor histidine kinase [Terriglobus saanensis]|uniref:Signal transduction histidine kinase, LytS n=1 Tax=Terriglobus saanensis (strain ATCC BAA-1853 / DSM 23119 / SP1PR4) TaxID=401053 RepID=E8V2I4_TERSS|nr:histidine kinase [Terriglobus saanensis]ADV82402.1 signal transduction histidine kinase, LytS [Terriglobus saanensis SP1PR4]
MRYLALRAPDKKATVSSLEESLPRAHGQRSIRARDWQVFLAVSIVLTLLMASECRSITAPASLRYGAIFSWWWGLVALGLWRLRLWAPSALRFTPTTVFLHLLAAVALGLLHLLVIGIVHSLIPGWPVHGNVQHLWLLYFDLNRFGIELLVYGFALGVTGLLFSQSQRQRDAIQTLTLERQLSRAQLKALQMQMEPHFLFNTLNALASLVAQGRNPEATKTLSHLDTILRTTLQRRTPEKVPFLEELRTIESYLAIQQVRFADRLRVEFDTTPEALEGLVPCFLLQPIIENAIQHGIAPMEAGGLIETRVERVGDSLCIRVRDNGSGSTTLLTAGHGIGLQNTRERLAFFYPHTHDFAAAPLVSGGYEVTIEIPYERIVV